jgi:hypothetical protein
MAIAMMLAGSTSTAGAETTVFRSGHFLLPIYVAADCGPEEREAAGELVRVLEAMSGIPTSFRTEGPFDSDGIYIGRTRASARHLSPLVEASDWLVPRSGEVGPDAFRIHSMGGSVYIEGATPEASYYAVSWLLQRQAGVRWYASGPQGELIPHRSEWSLPDLDLVREPGYLSRELSGFDKAEGAEWTRHNGLRGRFEFSHALGRVFPPELFAEHPDWFPLLWGERHRPTSVGDRDWQPNLALPSVAAHASQAALESFSREPARFTYSLGINDSMRFDQGPETRLFVEPMRYYRGMPDYSPLVATFMNRAATAVARVKPDRYLGCLAYFWCQNPPPFPVHSNIIPYLASDRTQYYDRAFRAGDLELMTGWGASGVRAFGIWDYAYGSGFVIPREPIVALTDAVREAWKRGARGYFAEMGPDQGFDAFKAWALAQLLWDPELSLTTLEDDFFEGYYAEAQAPMRHFYLACQAQWMGQKGPPFWLKYYGQEDQALLFSAETCRRLRAFLTEAVRLAADDRVVEARVELASRAFAVTEAYVEYDSERRTLAGACPDELDAFPGGEGALVEAIGRLARARARLDSAVGNVSLDEPRPVKLRVPDSLLRNEPVPRLLFGAGFRDSSAPRRILKSVGNEAAVPIPWNSMAEGLAGGLSAAPNIAINSSFLDAIAGEQEPRFLYSRYGSLPSDWTFRAMPTETGQASLVDEREPGGARLHRRLVRIEGAWDTQFYQWLPAKPGYAYLATARLRGLSSPGDDSALILTFLSGSGSVLGAWTQSLPKGETPRWRVEALCGRAPALAEWVGIGIECERQTPGDWMEADSVELRSGMGAPAQ